MIDAVAIETDTETEDVPVPPTTEAPDVARMRTVTRQVAAIASASVKIDTLDARGVVEIESGIATADPPDAMPEEMTMIARGEIATRTTTDAEADETEMRMPDLAAVNNNSNANVARRHRPRRESLHLI